jgi:hypothetical protein
MHGFFRKNSGIFGDLFSGLLCGQFCTTAGKIMFLRVNILPDYPPAKPRQA